MLIDRRTLLATGLAALTAGCQRPNRGDMVVDPKKSNRMYGMTSDGQPVFTDPAMFPNRRLKLTVRNMSGDPAWDLDDAREKIYQVFLDKGYERSDGRDFGLKVDLNVIRSKQFDADLMNEFAFLGAAAGGIYGSRRQAAGVGGATVTGMVAGATLGAIAGLFAADSIYVVVTEATFGILRNATRPRRVVTFEGSPRVEEWEESGYAAFRKVNRVTIANYGGGMRVGQDEIADDIRARAIRSLTSFI
ncbi:MAG: hypothetical protein HYU60_01850 [Magnetospirillum sp.]|nr:hypothetical protein [Magnetospirillum sp.]